MPPSLSAAIERLDSAVGERLDRAVRNHHRRRLAKLGHAHVFEPPPTGELWAADGTPPRAGNALEVLIDGERAIGEIFTAIQGARSHVHIAGWHITPDFELRRDGERITLRDALAELAERVDVRVLLWAGPPVPVFEPNAPRGEAIRDELARRHAGPLRARRA